MPVSLSTIFLTNHNLERVMAKKMEDKKSLFVQDVFVFVIRITKICASKLNLYYLVISFLRQCYLKSKLRCQKCCDGLKLDENRCV
jgi:hypothetical protein